MQIAFHSKYIIDANVMLAYMDEGEPFHKEVLDFFAQIEQFEKDGKKAKLLIPAHLYLEVNLKVGRKRKDEKAGINKTYKFRDPGKGLVFEAHDITLKFLKKIEDGKIYELMDDQLKPADFIYAAMAKLESAPIVTLDRDFLKVSSKVDVILLNPKIST